MIKVCDRNVQIAIILKLKFTLKFSNTRCNKQWFRNKKRNASNIRSKINGLLQD